MCFGINGALIAVYALCLGAGLGYKMADRGIDFSELFMMRIGIQAVYIAFDSLGSLCGNKQQKLAWIAHFSALMAGFCWVIIMLPAIGGGQNMFGGPQPYIVECGLQPRPVQQPNYPRPVTDPWNQPVIPYDFPEPNFEFEPVYEDEDDDLAPMFKTRASSYSTVAKRKPAAMAARATPKPPPKCLKFFVQSWKVEVDTAWTIATATMSVAALAGLLNVALRKIEEEPPVENPALGVELTPGGVTGGADAQTAEERQRLASLIAQSLARNGGGLSAPPQPPARGPQNPPGVPADSLAPGVP